MGTAPQLLGREVPEACDQRVFMYGLRFADYEAFLRARGDAPVPRLTYRGGTLEIMSPSWNHELLKTTLARLLEVWALERDVELTGVGAWTVKSEALERGLEPDECYVLGDEKKSVPDLAIEVNWTHGGLDKLDIYGALGVPEVWVWSEGALTIHRLESGGTYRQVPESVLLPRLDLPQLLSFLSADSQTKAVRGYLAALRDGA